MDKKQSKSLNDVKWPEEEEQDFDLKEAQAQATSTPGLDQDKFLEDYTFRIKDEGEKSDKSDHGITDNMSYRTEFLSTWEAFSTFYDTIWTSRQLWMMMFRLFLVSSTVAIIVFLIIPEPAELKVARFTKLSKFLNVIVGLLLGFFMKSSMSRWYNCVGGFLELLDAIRNLQMQMIALGVPDNQAFLLLRYAFSSGWLLFGQLLVETRKLERLACHTCPQDDADPGSCTQFEKERQEMWKMMVSKPLRLDREDKMKMLTEREALCLSKCRDPPGIMWMWVASLIGRLAQDGWIPPMASPTYGRIMGLSQDAHAGIRQVRAAVTIQAPFAYTHLLATLVHVNNLLNAVTFGIVAGLSLGTFTGGHGWHPFYKRDLATGQDVVRDWQSAVMTFGYCFLSPLVFQAILLMSMHLAQPFDSRFAYIPFDRLLHQLEVDLINGRDLVEQTKWEKPAFKKPA